MFFEEKFLFLLRLGLNDCFAQVRHYLLPLFFIKDLDSLKSLMKYLELLEQDNLDITHSTANYGFVPDLVDGTLPVCYH